MLQRCEWNARRRNSSYWLWRVVYELLPWRSTADDFHRVESIFASTADNGILIPATHDPQNTRHGGWSFPCRYVKKKDGVLIPATHDPQNARHGGWNFACRYVKKKDGDKRLVTMFQDLLLSIKTDIELRHFMPIAITPGPSLGTVNWKQPSMNDIKAYSDL
ncbi:predicted protein [Lichtheimia corymbifera JMRC:FSU:9682]|uniref:Uncharacterized protein n=1 Tax=Lichtheimia corymbifera JMRC:FSU:9682 TaxID=1263082 RepID=A0A068S8F7_9FUNG|nr:predicted protein [Lichtheimia corymbifera JMRC:FSU:9682]